MNKRTFLAELKTALTANHISDTDDIVLEYEEHFERKHADGYTEDEISSKLGDPKTVALQYAQIESDPVDNKNTGRKIMIAIGLGFADIFVFSFFASVYACIAAFASVAAAFVFSGICLLFQPVIPSHWVLPQMPYNGSVLLGIAIISLGVVFVIVTQYSILFTGKITKGFFRWHKSTFQESKKPPYVVFPILKKEKSRKIRIILVISLAVFALAFVAAFVLMAIQAGSVEFWHVWHWFE